MKHTAHPDTVLIIDFGSQVTQLIARRVREAGVYCEIVPVPERPRRPSRALQAQGASSSPAARPRSPTMGSPRAPQAVFDAGVPILGICYGQQTMARAARRRGRGRPRREFGRADVEIKEASPLFDGVWEVGERYPVWMSHGDRVTAAARGLRGRRHLARTRPSPSSPTRARRFYATMFHPEVVHTPDGAQAARATSCTRSPGCKARLDDGAPTAQRGDRQDPRAGRQRAG